MASLITVKKPSGPLPVGVGWANPPNDEPARIRQKQHPHDYAVRLACYKHNSKADSQNLRP